MPEDTIEFETDRGAHVTVTARKGTLYVDLTSDDLSFTRESASLTEKKGRNVLACGHQRTDDGEKINALVPIKEHKDALEELREASEPEPVEPTDEPLRYTVEEYQKTIGVDWKREVTKQRLAVTKSRQEMTERQTELHGRVDTEHDIPEGAEVGDEYRIDGLLDDPRTSEERDQDAIAEAADTGEEVVISTSTTSCSDPNRECSLDRVSRVATPDGEIKSRRTHTY
jgi:hypothetical protein